MTKKGKLDKELFEGATINTPSLLATEDYLDALKWGDRIGGLAALHARANANADVLTEWVARTPWVEFLVSDVAIRSNTSVCLTRRNLPRIWPRSWRGRASHSMRHRIGPPLPDCVSGVAPRSSKVICNP
jgi:phosphoserine aminotransferase